MSATLTRSASAGTTAASRTVRIDRSDRDEHTKACFEQLQDAPAAAERAALEGEIIALHIHFADRLSLRFQHRGVEHDDLVQVGRAALVAAVRRYRPGPGRTFTAFLGPTIIGEVKHYFRDATWSSVRPPRPLQELRGDVQQSQERLEQQLGRAVTHAEIAADLRVREAVVRECVRAQAAYHTSSLDLTFQDSPGPGPLSDRLAAAGDDFARVDDLLSLRSAMTRLKDSERQILAWRYVQDCTQAEIGRRLGVSPMQVSRLHQAILARLRKELGKQPGRGPRPVQRRLPVRDRRGSNPGQGQEVSSLQ